MADATIGESYQNLPLIQFVPVEMSARIYVLQAVRWHIGAMGVSRTPGILRQPLFECLAQGCALSTRDQARPLNQVLVSAQSDVPPAKMLLGSFA